MPQAQRFLNPALAQQPSVTMVRLASNKRTKRDYKLSDMRQLN